MTDNPVPGIASSPAPDAAPAPIEALDAMVDIETLGTKPFAPVLAIGACTFNMYMDPGQHELSEIVQDVFYQAITLESCFEAGLRADASTIKWWMVGDEENPANSPTDAARQRAFADPQAVKLPLALDAFTEWLNSRPLALWGNSARFDLGLIEAAYRACGKEVPWEFYRERCYRTIKNLKEARAVPLTRIGVHHNALDDAISQAVHLVTINHRLHLQL